MSPVSQSYLGIPGYLIFWLLFALAFGLFLQRTNFLVRRLKLGRPENRFDRPARRVIRMLAAAFSQSNNLKSVTWADPAAVGHALMFWGLAVFGVYYFVFIVLGAGLGLFAIYNGGTLQTLILSILDIAAALVIVSIIWVIVKRYIIKPERLNRPQTREDEAVQAMLLIGLLSLMFLHYGIEGFGYAAIGVTSSRPLAGSAIGNLVLNAGVTQDKLLLIFKSLWWLNYVLLIGALVYAPRSKHLHPLASFFNLTFQNLGPKGSLRLIDPANPQTRGAATIQDFTWKQLLDLYACTWCGRCHTVCPAQLSGKPLSPRELILGLKEHLLTQNPVLLQGGGTAAVSSEVPGKFPKPDRKAESAVSGSGRKVIGEVISEEAIWSCTTCRACQEVCPVGNEHIDKIIDLRRHLQMVATTETGREPLKNLRVRGNPWRGTTYSRTDWTENMNIKVAADQPDIDVLFWVGCTEALEGRSLRVAQAVARLMQQAHINFGILGEEEMCCGDPARRLGAEHIFQMLATNNIQTLQGYNIKKIVTACPHCFNTLKTEYPQLGGHFEVIHHSQLIAQLIEENRLNLRPAEGLSVTYQEPCYLGRYNGIFAAPRQILNSVPGLTLVEMRQNRSNGFCCGGGGGRMWLEEKEGQRVNEIRLNQALDTRAAVVATACPFCLQMLEDAGRSRVMGEAPRVVDLAELVAGSLE